MKLNGPFSPSAYGQAADMIYSIWDHVDPAWDPRVSPSEIARACKVMLDEEDE